MRYWLWLTLFLVGCGNAKDSCGNKVLVPWPVGAGQYNFQEVQLNTLNSPYELSGVPAKVYFEAGIGQNGYEGRVAQPRYTRSGGVCVPMDAESSLAVTVYAQFEKIFEFENRLGTAQLLDWPRKVGVNIHVRSSEGTTHNNAHYFSQGDAIAILPYNLNGTPLALNHGVVAHEHFHGHFQKQVINLVDASLTAAVPNLESLFYPLMLGVKPTVEDVDNLDMSRPRGLNAFVLRGWNEGLADLYGAIYSRNPRFFDESLPSIKDGRALTNDITPFMSAQELRLIAGRVEKSEQLVGVSYGQGAVLARLLYRIAYSGVETPERFLVRVMRNLKEIAPAVIPVYDSQFIDFEEVVPLVLRGFPYPSRICGFLRESLSKDIMQRSYRQCLIN